MAPADPHKPGTIAPGCFAQHSRGMRRHQDPPSGQPTGDDPTNSTSATVAELDLNQLVAQCAELSITEVDLDELVLDVLHEGASEAVNLSGGDFVAAFEQMHGDADEAAAEINNGGLRAQLSFLVRAWGLPATQQQLNS